MAENEKDTARCPVCRAPNVKQESIPAVAPLSHLGRQVRHARGWDAVHLYNCEQCGQFAVTGEDQEKFLDSDAVRARWFPLRLAALLREQTTKAVLGLRPFWIQFQDRDYVPLDLDPDDANALTKIRIEELLAQWPRTVPERLERTLCNLARLSPSGGDHVEIRPKDSSLAFAETRQEAAYYLTCLVHRGYLDDNRSHLQALVVMLTADGWERFEELTRGSSSPENPVFVAMWFGVKEKKEPSDRTTEEMTGIYLEGIKPAVERAGYRVSRVDLEEFNDSIMDKVFGDIRAAPFVVADFTGQRNGVYLEAGFARGLGRPVIQTCAESHFGKAHFDTRHLNHICWQDKADLQERLFQRIRGTIGLGPYASARRDDPA